MLFIIKVVQNGRKENTSKLAIFLMYPTTLICNARGK